MDLKPTCLFLILLLTGCSSSPSIPTGTPTAVASPAPSVFTPIPTLAGRAGVTLTPTLPAQPTPFVPFYVTTSADNVVLRSNPGYLFDAQLVLKDGSSLLVLGRAPGNEWILVQYPYALTGLDLAGWVYSQLITSTQGDLKSAPLIQPVDVQVVRGHVADGDGNPISGVQFAFVSGNADNAPRNDAMTDDQGNFYAYMPPTYNGTWSVGYVALSCRSNVMDANCSCQNGACGKVYPDSINVTLPDPNVLNFVWK